MAKLFYTLEEAAAKLSMSEDQVKELVASGKLGEYRDRDRLMFKVDQVDLLAHSDEDSGGGSAIPLAESGELGPISLASDSGSAMNLESPKEQTGISIFDAEQVEEADPSAVTQVTETAPPELQLDAGGSGSGLMDLTREADDTSLGADLLEGVAKDGSTAAETRAEEVGAEAGALFETTAPEAEVAVGVGSPALVHALAEPYDGPWSGITGGVAFAMVAVLALTLTIIIFGLGGMTDSPLVNMIADNFWPFVGGAGALVFLSAIIGWVLGKRS